MNDEDKTKEELIKELVGMRQRVSALERAEVDRKRTEQALQQASERLELALKAGRCGLWEYNVQTGEALFSQQRAEMLGYSLEEIEPHVSGWGRLVHPEDIPGVIEALNEHLEGRSAFYESHHRLRSKSGEWKWILARGRVVESDKEGKPLRFVGTSLDITQQKELEEKLIAERERLRQIFRLNPAVIYTAKPYGDYGVTFISSNVTAQLGYEPMEFLEDSSFWASHIHPEDVQGVFERLSSLFEQGHHVHEYRFGLKNGSYRWIRDEMTLTRDENGTPIEVMGYWIDITDRKQAEEALRKAHDDLEMRVRERTAELTTMNEVLLREIAERERAEEALKREREQLLSIFDSINEVISVIDAETYEILYVNKFMRNQYGKDLIGGLCYKELHGLDRPCGHCTKEIAISLRGEPYRWDYHNPTSNRDYLATDRIIKWTDGRDAKFHLGIDVTERRKAEEALRTSEAQLSNAVIMAHLGHWEYDVRTDLFTFNDHFYKIFRTTAEQVGGYTMSSAEYARRFVHPDDISLVDNEIRKAVEATDPHFGLQFEHRILCADGQIGHITVRFFIIKDDLGHTVKICGVNQDITERKRAEEALERRIIALTRPLDDTEEIAFEDLFNLDEIQKLQDQFAKAVGVASLITRTDGTPITKQSNFCRLCAEIVRKTEKGLIRCKYSDAMIGKYNPDGPTIQPCLSAGLCNAGSSISVGGRHIANWLIGQVRNEMQDADAMRAYARTIEADEEAFMKAFYEVPSMSQEKFVSVAQALHTLAGQLSTVAYQNVQQARFIAELNEVQERLRQSEEQYRAVFDNAGIGIDLLDREGRIVKVNRALLNILGYAEEELRQLRFLDITHPEDKEISKRKLESLMAGEIDSYRFEKRYVRKDGGIVWADLWSCNIRGSDGKHAGTVAVIEDITQRKKAEEALRQSEERYRALYDDNPSMYFTMDAQGTVLSVNRFGAEELGYSVQELVGQPVLMVFHPDDRQAALEQFTRCLQNPMQVADREFRKVRKDGSILWVKEAARAVRTADGSPVVLAVCEDITEGKRAERELQRSNDLLRAIIEAAPTPIVGLDLDGNVQTVWNPAAEKMLGWSAQEVMGRPLPSVPVESQEEFRRFRERVRSGKTLDGVEVRRQKRDGTPIDYSVYASPLHDAEGRITGIIFVLVDITERKQAEEEKERLQAQLLQAQKMEAIGTLAGGIAHDFNNLLQVVLGYSDLLLLRKKATDPEYAALHAIRQAGKDGSELAKRILAFSRRLEPNARPLNLNNEISRLQKMLERMVPRMIRIELHLADELMTVNADPGQMEQTLLNLVVNAQHAMPDGGRLTIETANVTLDEDYSRTHLDVEPGEYVLLTVSDTGHGMDKEVVEHIFEPFYTTKGLGEGTGLGLAMVFGIVKSHKGHVTCYSEPGTGTTFKIYLPAIVQEIEQDVAVTQQMPAFGTETILLVDDEKSIRKLGEEMLRMAGYSVLTADNGKEALEVYRSNKGSIALVLLDLIMPEMGGKQCLEELLKINPRVKVVIASGYSANGPTEEALTSGAHGFVNKPYDIRQVLGVVRGVLDAE